MNQQILNRSIVMDSVLRGITQETFPALRAMTIQWSDSAVKLIAYIDGEIHEEDEESLSCMTTEIVADLWPISVDYEAIRIDSPTPITDHRTWIYQRRETPPVTLIQHPRYRHEILGNDSEQWLTIDRSNMEEVCRRALLGNVFPSLRSIVIEWTKTSLQINAMIDGPPQTEDLASIAAIRSSIIAEYGSGVSITYNVFRLDFPAQMNQLDVEKTNTERLGVYYRREY